MADNDIKSEEIVSAAITPVPNLCDDSGWDGTRDRDTGGANLDPTNPANRKPGARGISKSSPSNTGNSGSQGS